MVTQSFFDVLKWAVEFIDEKKMNADQKFYLEKSRSTLNLTKNQNRIEPM